MGGSERAASIPPQQSKKQTRSLPLRTRAPIRSILLSSSNQNQPPIIPAHLLQFPQYSAAKIIINFSPIARKRSGRKHPLDEVHCRSNNYPNLIILSML